MKDPVEAVLKYLRDQNRPYSTNDVVLNLHKEHGKTAVQKAIDTLVAEGRVVEKVNGKQKAYVINQSEMPAVSEEELAGLDAKVREAEASLKEKSDLLKKSDAALKTLQAAPTTEEAKARVSELRATVARLEDRLHKLSNQQELVTKEDKERIESLHESSVKEWKKRKRMCTSVMDAILEGYPKPKKVFLEEVGIEPDEGVLP